MSRWLAMPHSAFLAQIEIPPPLSWWLDCYTLAVIVILYVTGHRFIQGEPTLARWGIHLGGLVFLGSFIVGLSDIGQLEGQPVLHSLGGALFLGATVIIVSWHLFPLVAFLFRNVWAPIWYRCRSSAARLRWRLSASKRRELELLAEKQARQDRLDARNREKLDADLLGENRRREAHERKRRETTRAKVDLFYASHGPTLGQRFPQSTFRDFVSRYLGDQRTAEDVEESAAKLLQAMQQKLDECTVEPKKSPLDELLTAHKEQSERLKREDLPEDMKETLDALLQQQMYDKLQRAMEEDQ